MRILYLILRQGLQDDVFWFQVSVDDALLMKVEDPICNLGKDFVHPCLRHAITALRLWQNLLRWKENEICFTTIAWTRTTPLLVLTEFIRPARHAAQILTGDVMSALELSMTRWKQKTMSWNILKTPKTEGYNNLNFYLPNKIHRPFIN